MKKLSIALKKTKTSTGWYYFSTNDKELHITTGRDIPGLTLILRGNEGFGGKYPVRKNVPLTEKLEHYTGYFCFKYKPIENDIVIDVDIIT
jgi:hypothetical protein